MSTTTLESHHDHDHRGRGSARPPKKGPAEQLLAEWTQALTDWWDSSSTALDPLWKAWLPAAKPGRGESHDDCGCGCGSRDTDCCDPCACCIPEADIVVHARVGESRVVVLEVANERRREREVVVGLGAWTRCDGPALELGGEVDAAELTLAPCERRLIRLTITVGVPDANLDQASRDVVACASAYADLRFEGCSSPVRVAVVVHPADCDAYRVDCGCGCC